jgi:periplasmic divalent cation tolerance protein
MDEAYGVVVTTVASETEAEQLARLLLEQRLVACVQIAPIRSFYRWQGSIQAGQEQQLSIKCRCSDYEAIQCLLQAHHSYENPEIILVPISDGASAYLAWIDEVTQ